MYGPTLPPGVKDSVFPENLGNDRDCGIHRVGNDEHVCFWSGRCDACSKIAHDSSIDLGVAGNC